MNDTSRPNPRSQPRRPNPLPQEQREELRHAHRLEWVTLILRLTVIAALYAVVGGSQALGAIWLKSLWALLPPAAFLAALHVESRAPTERFPYGFYRAGSIGFLTAALALCSMGVYLLISVTRSLIGPHSASLHSFAEAGGVLQWPGWWVVAALVYSASVPWIIGGKRRGYAIALHDKGLYADASMGRMNWVAGSMAIVGVVGIGLGQSWLDTLATLLIGLYILWHGVRHLRTAVCDLMDEVPRRIGSSEIDPLSDRIRRHLSGLDWVEDVRVRLREEGRLLTGIALICPDESQATLDDFETARGEIDAMDWRLLEFQLVPVARSEFVRYCHAIE